MTVTVFGLLERASQNYPDKEAIFDGANRITYKRLMEETQSIAAALSQRVIKKGTGSSFPFPIGMKP